MAIPKNRRAAITKILRQQGIPDEQIKLLGPTIEHIVWLEEKMEQGRKLIAASAIVVPYDNGGGQSGIRKNPAYEAIHRMTSSYNATMKTIEDVIRMYADADDMSSKSYSSTSQAAAAAIARLRNAEKSRGDGNGN